MTQKQLVRKSETETDKQLGVIAAKTNDKHLERSMKEYQQLVESKQRLNQLILKASKEHQLKNFSTVEQERNGSLERLFERQ